MRVRRSISESRKPKSECNGAHGPGTSSTQTEVAGFSEKWSGGPNCLGGSFGHVRDSLRFVQANDFDSKRSRALIATVADRHRPEQY